jgi:hypothetical protein
MQRIPLTILGYSGKQLPVPVIFEPLLKGGLFIFRSKANMALVGHIAVILHVLETIYAFALLQKKGVRKPSYVLFWLIQSFINGFPSIQLIKQLPDAKAKSQ